MNNNVTILNNDPINILYICLRIIYIIKQINLMLLLSNNKNITNSIITALQKFIK